MVQSNLKVFREKAKLSQEALGELMNTTKTTIYRLETNRQPFDEHWILAACKVFKCRVKDLFDFDSHEFATPQSSSEIYLSGTILNSYAGASWQCNGCGGWFAPHIAECPRCNNHFSNPPTKQKEKRK